MVISCDDHCETQLTDLISLRIAFQMQLFFVSLCPRQAAQDLSDVHVRKMPLETAQLLSTAYRVLKSLTKLAIYKSYNPGNRLVKWLVSSSANFKWLLEHGIALCEEFKYRSNSEHASKVVITLIAANWDELDFPSDVFSLPPLVMDQFSNLIVKDDPIESNRNLLRIGKRVICHYILKPDRRPLWFDMYPRRPIVVNSNGVVGYDLDVSREGSIWLTADIKKMVSSDFGLWLPRLLELEGETLTCSCPNMTTCSNMITCHGDAIADMVEDLSTLVNSDLSKDEFDARVKQFLASFK